MEKIPQTLDLDLVASLQRDCARLRVENDLLQNQVERYRKKMSRMEEQLEEYSHNDRIDHEARRNARKYGTENTDLKVTILSLEREIATLRRKLP